jgi:cytochrome P450/nitrite reductase/ring-hydroxylating ferredoxin subunit
MAQHISIAHITALSEGHLVAAQVEGVELVVVNVNGTITAFEGRCPHQGTLLAEGTITHGTLVCRAHGWRFDCASGARVDEPQVCLQQFPVSIVDGHVMVDRDAVLAWKHRQQDQVLSTSHRLARRSLSQLPGPRGLPLLGNSLQLDMPRFHLVLEQWCEMFGPMFTFKIGTRPVVVIADPALANTMLRDRPEGYRRLATIEPVLDELGVNGVFSAEGDNWRRQRHLVMQALDTRHLRQFFPVLRKVTERLQQRWHEAAERQQPVDVQKDLMRYTVDVTTNLAFGYDMNTLEKEGDVIQRHLEKIFPIISRRIFAPLPYWRYVKLPSDRALDNALVEIRKTIHAFIAHSRQQLARDPNLAQHPTNLLEAMLAARDEGKAHFHDDEIFGNVFTMLLAGEDTTANTLAWAMHFMTERPDVQAAMQTEVDTVLGSATMLHDFAQSRQLAYVDAVASETMRLKPVAPILGLETNVEVEIDGLQIPPKTSIILLTRPGVLQEHHFPQAEAFRPERWLAAPSSRNIEAHKAFMPFGSGPRLCPGRSLALLEMTTALAMTCRNFDLTKASPAQPVHELFAFTMMPMHLSVRFSPRGTS